jgi:hypothetical protein
VVQMETKPQVGNRFRDVDAIVRAKPKPPAGK